MNTEGYGLAFAHCREARGLSQSAAGRLLGKARESLSLLERGKFAYPPTPEEMQLYAEHIGFSVVNQLLALGYPVAAPNWHQRQWLAVGLLGGMTEAKQRAAVTILRAVAELGE